MSKQKIPKGEHLYWAKMLLPMEWDGHDWIIPQRTHIAYDVAVLIRRDWLHEFPPRKKEKIYGNKQM